MSKRILFVNGGSKAFGQKFRAACSENNLDSTSIRTVHTAFRVANGTVDVIVNNEQLDLEAHHYCFLRVRAKTPHTASILLKLLATHGIPSNDPVLREHTDATEKLVQMVLLTRAGVPVPRTWLCTKRSFKANKESIVADLHFPCVLKTSGSQGRAVWKIDSAEALKEKMAQLDNKLMIIQEYVPNTFDIRALYMYGDCIGAIARSATDGFYNNISHGGNAQVIALTDEEREMGLRACAAVNVDFGGVDIVRTPSGPRVFEVNCGPQVYGFESATKINVPAALVDRIRSRLA